MEKRFILRINTTYKETPRGNLRSKHKFIKKRKKKKKGDIYTQSQVEFFVNVVHFENNKIA